MQPRRARQGNFHGNRNSLMHRMKPPDPSALPSLQARLDLVPRGAKTRPQVFRRQRRVARGRIVDRPVQALHTRSEEHTSELQSLMRSSYAVFCLTKKKNTKLNRTQKRQ